MTGPYGTERQAADAARHIIDSPAEAWRDGMHRLMDDACTAAGVKLGAYDHRILLWLAGWEPSTCAVVAGLITRAHQAGKASMAGRLAHLADRIDARLANEHADRQTIAEDAAAQLRTLGSDGPAQSLALDEGQAATVVDALEVAAEYRRYRAGLTCEACAGSPTEVCPDHEADLDRADEYDALAQQITEATR